MQRTLVAIGIAAMVAACGQTAPPAPPTLVPSTPFPVPLSSGTPDTAPSGVITRDGAIELATRFYTDPVTHGPGTTVSGTAIEDVQRMVVSGQATWRVTIHGSVTEHDAAGKAHATYGSAMILDIDATGAVTVWAQG